MIRARRVDVAARLSHPFTRSPPSRRVNGSTACTGLDRMSASLATRRPAIEMRSTDLCHTHPVKDRVIPEGSKLADGMERNSTPPGAWRLVAQRALRRAAHAAIETEVPTCRLAATKTHAYRRFRSRDSVPKHGAVRPTTCGHRRRPLLSTRARRACAYPKPAKATSIASREATSDSRMPSIARRPASPRDRSPHPPS